MLEFLDRLDRWERSLDKVLPAGPEDPSPPSDAQPEPIELSGVWVPHEGPQRAFFESTCREILYGGAAGGGKSEALTALPLRWVHLPGFLSLTLRRETTQARDLQQKSRRLYRQAFPGLRPVKTPRYVWTFPSSAEAAYGHCQNLDDYDQFDGWEINLLCLDELTHFTEQQYKALCARVRSADPRLPTLIRATSNPGGDGHEWVFRHWGAWLDPEFEAPGLPSKAEREPGNPPALPGEVWWIRTVDGAAHYYREPPDDGGPPALSRTFIPARLSDNPTLAANDPNYAAELEKLDALRRVQLRDGDWLAKPAAGLYFKREWCEIVEPDDVPADAQLVRQWDLASTQEGAPGDPDWTVGLKMARKGSLYWVVDVQRFRKSPGGVDAAQRATAEHDGRGCAVGMFQDPGQAGVDQARKKVQLLAGYALKVARETGNIVTRFGPFSSQAEHHNVRIVRGAWNRKFFEELEAFPDDEHDDQVSAAAGAFHALTGSTQGFGAAGSSRSGSRAA